MSYTARPGRRDAEMARYIDGLKVATRHSGTAS
jgi:hypothetical protein